MAVDVYLCTMGLPDRLEMRNACIERWTEEPGILFRYITPTHDMNGQEFQKERRVYADENAESPIYVVADDDCLLGPDPIIVPMLSLMDAHPEIRILSLMPDNCTIYPWTPEDYTPILTDDIMEHVSVGTIRFCRKPVVKEWPACLGRGYDREQCEQVRKEGGRVAYARNIKMTHLGQGKTTVW